MMNDNDDVCVCVSVAVDLYFAPYDNVFAVSVDAVTGVHNMSIDPRYRYVRHNSDTGAQQLLRARRSSHNDSVTDDLATDNSTADDDRADKIYELMETTATQFVTFVTVPRPDVFLVVHNVHNRLVIMLPNTAHQLKVSRFYLVLTGTANTSYGIVYFRQDQPHIDLFVFFSVFFSCFFLFLAGCVLLWKMKQVVDRQRTRHRRQIEMQDMASRPCASVMVYVRYTQADHAQPDQPAARDHTGRDHTARQDHHQQQRLVRLIKSNSHRELQLHDSTSRDSAETGLRLSPLALEPTRNSVAVVATFVFELPCSNVAPVRACLGSCLLTSRILHGANAASGHHISAKPAVVRSRSSVT